jgi:valyl-tRNA synthetase
VVENPEDYIDPETSFGDKKQMSRQLARKYNPTAVEKS